MELAGCRDEDKLMLHAGWDAAHNNIPNQVRVTKVNE